MAHWHARGPAVAGGLPTPRPRARPGLQSAARLSTLARCQHEHREHTVDKLTHILDMNLLPDELVEMATYHRAEAALEPALAFHHAVLDAHDQAAALARLTGLTGGVNGNPTRATATSRSRVLAQALIVTSESSSSCSHWVRPAAFYSAVSSR
ncbi:hypothetical protein [Streptomyces sp. KR55]|uniref:hypothetical protein n=1 Tax=Streptomyces sp. KR55 TaxID=3457425 RepID=UPI003FD31C72